MVSTEFLYALITPPRYTEHSTVSLAQQWDQLGQMVMRMQHNLEQQIQARSGREGRGGEGRGEGGEGRGGGRRGGEGGIRTERGGK